MNSIPTPAAHDIGRLWRPTVDETFDALVEFTIAARPPWNYAPARNVAHACISGALSWEAIRRYCDKAGHVDGREHNKAVCEMIWSATRGKEFLVRKNRPQFIHLRPGDEGTRVKVHAELSYQEASKVKILALQPRKFFAPDELGLKIWMSLLASVYKVDEFSHAELQILNLAALTGTKERCVRWHSDTQVKLLDPKELNEALSIFVEALDRVRAWGIRPPPREARNDASKDQHSPGLFD